MAQRNFAAAETDLTNALEQSQASHDIVHDFNMDEAFSTLKERQSDLDAAEQWLSKAAAITN